MKLTIISTIAIAGMTSYLPANASSLIDQYSISQIPVEVKEITNPNLNSTPENYNPPIANPNISQIQIFDPLRSNSPTSAVPIPPVDRRPLTGRIIPVASAIVVTLPSDIQLDAGGSTSITLILSRAILDGNGDEVAPVNSLVSAKIQPERGGVKIVAESLILRSKHILIQASSATYRGETTTIASGVSKSDSLGTIGEILFRPFGDVMGIGRGVGALIGLFSPEHQTTIRIPQGTTFVLSLQSALTLQ